MPKEIQFPNRSEKVRVNSEIGHGSYLALSSSHPGNWIISVLICRAKSLKAGFTKSTEIIAKT
jgi:hypothetical protein